MFRVSMVFGFVILALALLVSTSESQEKKDKGKAPLPAGFKGLNLTPTQDEKVRSIGAEYKTKIDELNKKIKELGAEKLRAELAVLTEEQREQYVRNKTGEEAKKKDAKKDAPKDKAPEKDKNTEK